ncbi:MAG: CopG family ribbon-helix-helix protein [Thaumarchaeota archaeon]|nr:CopG family ribbon-helix-helix protein [Nitrososphaerota archaeon]
MKIVSLSLPDKMVETMDEIQASLGFSGRSELVRAALRSMLDDIHDKDSLTGYINGLIVVTHGQNEEAPVTTLKHKYEDIIKTHVHSKTASSICVELFLVQGPAKKVVEMSKAFQAEDKMKSTKFMPV